MTHPGGRPRKWKSAAEMQKAIDRYFAETQPPYTVTGLALALDMTRQGLLDYAMRGEFADTVKRAKGRVEQWIESGLLAGDVPGAAGIFNLKNNFGWRDEQHIEQTGKQEIVVRYAGDGDAAETSP